MEKPCVYHYLFSRLPDYRTDEIVTTLAHSISSSIIETFKLDNDEILDSPHPDVKLLMYKGNNETETYSLQFWFNDILTTVLTFNQTARDQDPLLYFQGRLNPDFPDPETHVRFGEMTVLFAQAKANISAVQQIASACFNTEIDDDLPNCQFEWGTLYFISEMKRYVLFIPDPNNLALGDTFLAFDFPMLEAIRQKLNYEESEANKLKGQNIKIELQLRELLHLITEKLNGGEDSLREAEELLDRIDDTQSGIYDNISKTETTLHTLAINIRNFDLYLQPIPIKHDDLFQPVSKTFRFIYENIEAGLKYTKLLLPSIVKRLETIPIKLDLLRQKTQEQNNRIERRQNILIAVLGVTIGANAVLPNNLPWEEKLLWMGLAGLIVFLLVRLVDLNFFKRKK